MNGTLVNDTDTNEKTSKKHYNDVETVQDLVSRYVGQLLHGCGDATCKETACGTGRRNVSRGPVRDYTPRSARAIAITLVSGPYPRSRLCSKYRSEQHHSTQDPADGPRDPSAFLQQLSDTPSIRGACSRSSQHVGQYGNIRSVDAHPRDQAYFKNLKYWHKILNAYSRQSASWNPQTPLSVILDGNIAVANELSKCFEWLSSTLPDANNHDWTLANIFIQKGDVYPKYSSLTDHEERNRVICLLDSLNHKPSFRLLSRLVEVVAENKASAFDAYYNMVRRADANWTNYASRSLDWLLARRLIDASVPSIHPLRSLIIWLRKVFLRYWDGKVMFSKGSIALAALRILDHIASQTYLNENHLAGDEINENGGIWAFFQAIPARIDAAELVQSYMDASDQETEFHILTQVSSFTPKQLATYFRTMNHLKMQQAHSEAEKASAIRLRHEHLDLDDEAGDRLKWMEAHYLLLNISRQKIVQDTFDQIWQRRKTELLRPLRVRLGETDELEIGHDLGGVQIEFFNLLWRELLKEESQLFTTDDSTGLTYFRPGSLQPLYMFELCGLLFALAVYNGITLPVNFPLALYGRFTIRGGTKPIISDRWPEVSQSLEMILKDDIPGLEAVFPFEANGVRLSVLAHEVPFRHDATDSRVCLCIAEASRIGRHELTDSSGMRTEQKLDPAFGRSKEVDIESIEQAWPGWRLVKVDKPPSELNADTKHEYVSNYKRWLAWGSVAPQLNAFEKGFTAIIDLVSTRILTKADLRTIVEGTRSFDINDLMSVTQYEGYDNDSRYIRTFWRLINNWPEAKQRQLLKFVTAIERMPAGGASNFTFKIERPRPDEPEKLPTSSTCFRTLYLPKYPSADALDKKLSLAFEYGLEGFGTG